MEHYRFVNCHAALTAPTCLGILRQLVAAVDSISDIDTPGRVVAGPNKAFVDYIRFISSRRFIEYVTINQDPWLAS